MDRLNEREGIPFNRITSINFTDEVLPNLRHILTLRDNKTTLCKIQPQILVLDVICSFYKTFNINPVYKENNQHVKNLIPKSSDHSFNEKRFLLFESSFADKLKALSDEEITAKALRWSELVFLTRLNIPSIFQIDGQVGRLQTLNTWELEYSDPVFSVMRRIRDGDDLTITSYFNSKKSYKEAENEAIVRNIKKFLPFRISMLLLVLKNTNKVVMQRHEFEELKLFCGIKKGKESEQINSYLQRNFFIIFTKKADSSLIVQPFVTINVLSQFFKEAKKSNNFSLNVYPFSKNKNYDGRVKAMMEMCKENTFCRFFAPQIWDDFDTVWNYLVENDIFRKVFEYFQMQSLEPKKSRFHMDSVCNRTPVACFRRAKSMRHGELYFRKQLVEEHDKLVFCYKNNDNMYVDLSQETFQSIKSAFFENLKLNTKKNQEKSHSVIFTYDYGLTFVISRMLYKGDIHLIGLSLCSVGEGDPDVYLYRSIETIAAYTCNKVRETLEGTICEVMPQLSDLEKDYYFHHKDYVIPYFPLQGLPPACLENWFPRNLFIENNRSSRVLLLDGGGVKGIIEATTLMLISYSVYLHSRKKQDDVKNKTTLMDFITHQQYCCDFTKTLAYPQIHELFDVIVGTSTGSLIATGLARNGDNPIQLMHKFITSANSIFPSHFCQKIRGNYRKVCTNRPQFDETPLVEFLSREFEKISQRFPILGIVAQKNSIFSSTGMQSALFDSRHHDDTVLKDAVQASAAAPTYFRKKEIGSDSFVDGGFGSNCPVKEGMHMTKDVAKLEGEAYTKSECTISLGCGYGDVVDTLPAFGLGWLTKSSNVLTDGQKNWEDYPEKGRVGIRLNPGRDFGVGKYDLADSKNTETMALDYLRTLATQQNSKEGRNIRPANRHGLYITHLKIDQLSFPVTSNEKMFVNCESIKLVTLTFNELLEEKKVCVVQNKILIGDELEIEMKCNRRIAFARCVMDCIEVEFEGQFHFDDTMQMEVSYVSNEKQQKRVACFNIKVASEKAFYNEIENAAACLFAKNIYVCEGNRDGLVQCEQSADSTEDSDLFKVTLNFACLSGHGCHIEKLVQKSAAESQVPKAKKTKKQFNSTFKGDKLNINCGKCQQQRVEKKPVFVDELTLSVEGSSMKLTDVSEPCVFESDGDITTKVTLKITANRLPMTAGFKIGFHYADREISGSPMNFALSEQHPKVLQRFYRKDFSNSAIVELNSWTLLCVDHGKDHTQVSTIVKADDLVKYAEETEQTLVLLSRCKTFHEYYIRSSEHVINRARKSSVTRYILAENVKDIELLRLERNSVKSKYEFRYGGFLESLNYIAKYRKETPDQLMENLRKAQDDYRGHINLFYGFPVQAGEDDLAYGKAALITLAQVYNVKLVVQTFDHRKQEFYIRHRYHIVTPRSVEYFKKNPEFEYKGAENKSSNQLLDGVVFVEMADLKKWNNADVLRKYYSDVTQNSFDTEPVEFTAFDEIKAVSLEILGEDANTKEYLLHYVEEKDTRIVFLTRDSNINEYFLRKDCHILSPTTSGENTKVCVYLDLSNKVNKELGTVLESIESTIDKVSSDPVKEFYRQLTQLEEHKELTWEDFQLSLNEHHNCNKEWYTGFFGDNNIKEQRHQLDLVSLSENYNVKTVILTHNQRLDEYFIQAPWHVLRPWGSPSRETLWYLDATIFIREKCKIISNA